MGEIVFDDAEYPLVVVRFDGGFSDDAFFRYLGQLDLMTDRAFRDRQRVSFVMDARATVTPQPSQRRAMGDWMKQNQQAAAATCAGFAFVIPSAIVRGALTAILWISPMPAPHALFGEMGPALTWAREQLRDAQAVPPDTRASWPS